MFDDWGMDIVMRLIWMQVSSRFSVKGCVVVHWFLYSREVAREKNLSLTKCVKACAQVVNDLQLLYLWLVRIIVIECERDCEGLFMKEIDKHSLKQIELLFLCMYCIHFYFSSAIDALTVFQVERYIISRTDTPHHDQRYILGRITGGKLLMEL